MQSQQLLTLMRMQDEMNTKVNPSWREQGNEWYRAIWVESAEMLDHYGWKWWKHQECDREQVILELIDIFHFGLSDLIEQEHNLVALAAKVADSWPQELPTKDFKLALEDFTLQVLSTKKFDLASFLTLAKQVDVDSNAIYRGYIAKNVLNMFRQDFGYKDGSYIKVWNGREDNEVLVELRDQLDAGSPTFKEDLYKGLVAAYPTANAC